MNRFLFLAAAVVFWAAGTTPLCADEESPGARTSLGVELALNSAYDVIALPVSLVALRHTTGLLGVHTGLGVGFTKSDINLFAVEDSKYKTFVSSSGINMGGFVSERMRLFLGPRLDFTRLNYGGETFDAIFVGAEAGIDLFLTEHLHLASSLLRAGKEFVIYRDDELDNADGHSIRLLPTLYAGYVF